jgi:hypothetical protein
MVTPVTILDAAGVARSVQTLEALMTLVGEVQASPTSNTLLDRLKSITTALSGNVTTALGKLEDAAHASGDAGVMALGVRQDALSALGADGDYGPFILDATGRMYVNIHASATSIAKAEDGVHSSLDTGAFVLAVRRDTAASGAADGDYVSFNVDASGRLWTNPGLVVEDAAAAADPSGLPMMAVRRDTLVTNEVSAENDIMALKSDNLGRLHVSAGAAAHDAAILGNPSRIGARALTTNYTAVATGDTADLVATLVGALITKPYSIPNADWAYAAATLGITNTTTAVTIKTAAAAGLKNYITAIDISTDGALATASEIAIRDGAGGTVLWRMKIGTAGLQGGRTIVFPTPIAGTAATLLEVVALTQFATGAVYFNATGYVAP